MPDDLFGSRTAHIDRFRVVVKSPRRKAGSVARVPVPRVVHSPELIERVRKARALDYYVWAIEELAHWKHRLPPLEWERLRSHVESLKPES